MTTLTPRQSEKKDDSCFTSSWLTSRQQFERDNPAPPLRPIVCCVCGPTVSRYDYKRDGKDICGVCLDATVALSFTRNQSTQPF